MAEAQYSSAEAKGQIESDPRQMLPVRTTGSMYAWGTPAHKIGTAGSAYTYNGSPNSLPGVVVGGHTNLIHNGTAAHAVGNPSALTGGATGPFTLLLGGGFYNVLTTKAAGSFIVANPVDISTLYFLNYNGEFVFRGTSGALYGAANEVFTSPGTVTAANGSNVIVGAGTTFTTSNIPGYAYVLSKAIPQVGDMIRIVQAGVSYYHRIVTITSAVDMTIYPVYQGAGGAGLTYDLRRDGFGSYSRTVSIFDGTSTYYNYYAGNSRSFAVPGTIECVTSTFAHFTCPQTSAGLDVKAEDIAYYKGFLLYGAGSSISWSVAGFPTSFATGFGATDFPAGNITVVDNTDFFVSFEFIGDQLVALFFNSVWLVNPTGSVPEFNFYRLAEPVGANPLWGTGVEVPQDMIKFRPSCSARASVFYVSRTGLMELDGNVATNVSEPVSEIGQVLVNGTPTWESMTQSVILRRAGDELDNFVYTIPTKSWSATDYGLITTQGGAGLTGTVISSFGRTAQFVRFGAAMWRSEDQQLVTVDGTIGGIEAGHAGATIAWKWATPVLSLGDDYDGFKFGGFQAEGQNVANSTFTVYAGRTPYTLAIWDTGTIGADPQTNRNLYGAKTDAPFVAVTLSGTHWVQLVGINIYDSRAARGR